MIGNVSKELSTTTGTGNFTTTSLTADGFARLDATFGTGAANAFRYVIRHKTAAEYEAGYGYMNATGTLVRAFPNESSNAGALVSFSAGDKEVSCQISAEYLGKDIDRPYSGNLGFDFEPYADSTSLPSGFSWVNQGSAAYRQQFGWATLNTASAASNVRGIFRSLSGAPSTWMAVAKLRLTGVQADFAQCSLSLRDSVSGEIASFTIPQLAAAVTNRSAALHLWNSPTSFNSTAGSSVMPEGLEYLAIRKNSSTNWDFIASRVGGIPIDAYQAVLFTYNLGAFMTPDEIGFTCGSSNGSNISAHCRFIRLR